MKKQRRSEATPEQKCLAIEYTHMKTSFLMTTIILVEYDTTVLDAVVVGELGCNSEKYLVYWYTNTCNVNLPGIISLTEILQSD